MSGTFILKSNLTDAEIRKLGKLYVDYYQVWKGRETEESLELQRRKKRLEAEEVQSWKRMIKRKFIRRGKIEALEEAKEERTSESNGLERLHHKPLL